MSKNLSQVGDHSSSWSGIRRCRARNVERSARSGGLLNCPLREVEAECIADGVELRKLLDIGPSETGVEQKLLVEHRRLAEPAVNILAALDAGNAVLDTVGFRGGLGLRSDNAGSGRLGLGDQSLVIRGAVGVQPGKRIPNPCIGLGVIQLQRPLLVRCNHRNAGVNGFEQLRLRRSVNPVAQACQSLIQPSPKRDTARNCLRMIHHAEHRNVLVADPAVIPVVLDQAGLQAGLGLAEANNMVAR